MQHRAGLSAAEREIERTEALRGLVDAIVLTPDQAREALRDRVSGQSGRDARGDHTNEELVEIR